MALASKISFEFDSRLSRHLETIMQVYSLTTVARHLYCRYWQAVPSLRSRAVFAQSFRHCRWHAGCGQWRSGPGAKLGKAKGNAHHGPSLWLFRLWENPGAGNWRIAGTSSHDTDSQLLSASVKLNRQNCLCKGWESIITFSTQLMFW